MKKKGVSPVVATVMLVAVAITFAVAVSYWMRPIVDPYQPDFNHSYYSVGYDWESVDAFNGTDKGYRGCAFKYNTTVFVDCSGNGWLLYENSTHAFVQKIATFDGWTALKKVIK